MLNCGVMVKILEGVFVEKINNTEMFAINITTGTFVSIDRIGMLIFEFIAEPHCIGDIIKKIQDEYDCENDITNDIIEFIDKAIAENFIKRI